MNRINPEPRFLFLLTLFLLLAAPFSTWATAFNQASEEPAAIANGPLVAVILPLSGPFAKYGKTLQKGYEEGFSVAENSQETPAPQYRVKYLDSKSDPETASALINLLNSEGEVAIATGTPLNATAWTVSRTCEKNHLPYLIVGADQDNLINRNSVYIFRLTPQHSAFKQMLAGFMAVQEPEIKTMGIIYSNSICAIKKARQLRAFCAAKSIDLAIWKQWQTSNNNRNNFYDLLNAVKERQPEILFLVTSPTLTNQFWQQGQRLETMPQTTIAIPTGTIATVPEVVTDSSETEIPAKQLLFAAPWISPGSSSSTAGENINIADNPLAASGSAAAALILDCLKRSSNLTAAAIIKSMEATKLETVYGAVDFTTKRSGHQNPAPWYLYCRNNNGHTKIIFPKQK